MQNPPGGARGKNKGAGGGRNPYQTNLEPADLEYNQNVASGADARRLYQIGTRYRSADETLARLGYPPNRAAGTTGAPLRRAA